MAFSLRSIRRFLRIGYVSPRSCFTNFLYIVIIFITFSFVATHLTAQNAKENNIPHPGKPRFDLHNELQVNRQRLAEYHAQERDGHNDLPLRGDNVVQKQIIRNNVPAASGRKEIDGQPYPKLINGDKFVPTRKLVHLDLKGGAYKPSFFPQLFAFFKKIGLTGVLLEWEDMFPYTGKLSEAINGDAYSISDIEAILQSAKDNQLDIVPLVQTFGHLEWILKLEQFKHLREDKKYPQVICFANNEAFEIIKQMIDQVATIHKKFEMNFFHMGADEAFQVGYCNETIQQITKEGNKDRVMLWHISRVAKYIKTTHSVTVLAWHDMFGHVAENDLKSYEMTEVLEPVLWSYAEDLEQYLPFSSWLALKPFKNVWGSSAFKGADGPMRYNSNPMHYIKNHESWVVQMARAYREFEYFQGLIITGWSRYDHMAVLAELLPVNLPTLVMCIETIESGRPLHGNFQKANQLLQCTAKYDQGYIYGCQFPGRKIYELVNEMYSQKDAMHKYIESDFEFNGWLSKVAEKYHFSSPMYIEKIAQLVDYNLNPLERIERDLRNEMAKIYFNETVDEFIFTYLSDDLEFLRKRKAAMSEILSAPSYQKRPYIKYPLEKMVKQ
jgi:hexosaminidase